MDPEILAQLSMLGKMDNVILTNDWFQKTGKAIDSVIPGVIWSVYAPVMFSSMSPWPESSQCLADFRPKTGHDALVNVIQLLLLATEMWKNGTPHIKVSKERQGRLYDQVVRAYCCVHMGYDVSQNQKLVDEYVAYKAYFDPVVHKDIQEMKKKVIQERVKGGGQRRGGGEDPFEVVEPQMVDIPAIPQQGNDSEMDAWAQDVRRILLENGTNMEDLPEQAIQVLEQFREMSPTERWIRDHLIAEPIDVLEERDLFETSEYMAELMEEDMCRRCGSPRPMWPLKPVSIFEERARQEQAEEEVIREAVLTSKILPKVHTSFFKITDKLCLFRFSVLDPGFLLSHVENLLSRFGGDAGAARVVSQKNMYNAGANVKDPFAALRFLGKQHIAGRDYNSMAYVQDMGYFLGARNPIDYRRASQGGMFSDHLHEFHVSQCCTMERCMDILRVSATSTIEKECVTTFEMAMREFDRQKVTGYPDNFEHYTLHPEQCFYTHEKYLGIGFTRWFFKLTKENFAADVAARRIQIINNQLVKASESSAAPNGSFQELAQRRMDNPLLDKSEFQGKYKTGDQLMIWERETEEATKIIMQLFPEDPEKDPARYAEYCEARRRMRESGIDKFCSIWNTDGNMENKPVATSIKALCRRLAEILKNHQKTLTCHMPYYDLHMTVWGNSCILRMTILATGKTIINARIPFFASGLNSAFDMTRAGKPSMHIQVCGPPEAGKSYPFHGFMKSCYIEGTWVVIHSSSDKAFYTDVHIGPRIALCDEPPKYVTRKEAEDSHYEKVQELKDVLINKQRTRTVLDIVVYNGVAVRVPKHIVTDDATTWAYCTNQPRDKNHPLGTRMFQVTVPLPAKPPEEYQYDPRAVYSEDTKMFFNIDQILTVSVYCAIRCGVIPDVDMWLPNLVMERVYKLLRAWNVIDSRKGNRSLQIIETYIRHQTIIRAVTATYHVPGGPLYNQPYDPAQVHLVGPRLVPTLEIIFAVLHLMASEIIDEEVPVVWRALCSMARYDLKKTALENDKCAFFRKESAHNSKQAQLNVPDTDRFKVNLNYISFPGTLDAIAIRLESYCKPRLSSKQILDVLKSMKEHPQIHTRNGKKYKSIPQSQWENYTAGNGFRDDKGVDVTPLSFADWIMVDEEYITACEYRDDLKQLYICPDILETFDIDILDRAFYQATMNANFPRIHAIRGVVYDEHPDLFEVAKWSDKFVRDYVEVIDKEVSELKVSRGCAVPTRERMTQTEQEIVLSTQLNPNRVNHEEDYLKVLEARSLDFRVVVDWELQAAKRVAFRCGVSLDAHTEYWTDEKIFQAYVAFVKANQIALPLPSQQVKYPTSILKEREELEKKKAPAYRQMTVKLPQLPENEGATIASRLNLQFPVRRTAADRLRFLSSSSDDVTVAHSVERSVPSAHRSALEDALNSRNTNQLF